MDMKKLTDIKPGQRCKIIAFDKSLSRCNFARFALFEGKVIKCVAKIGPVIVKENDQTIAIGKKMSENIFVEMLDEEAV